MYSYAVLNLFNNPKNAGRISKPDGIADCFNADNTAHVEFSFRIESGIITECKFRAQANPYIVAVCSTITQMVKGKMVSMLFLDPYSIKKELGDESPIDIGYCIDCVKLAVDDYKEKLIKDQKQSKKQAKETENNIDALEEDLEESENIVEETKELKENTTNSNTDDDDDFADFFDDILEED